MFRHNWACIKLATDNFSTVLARNLRNPRDYAPVRLNRLKGASIDITQLSRFFVRAQTQRCI